MSQDIKKLLESFDSHSQGASIESIKDAIMWRLEIRHGDLLNQVDPQRLDDILYDVASFHEGAEELGSSDISGMVREVLRQLQAAPAQQPVTENAEELNIGDDVIITGNVQYKGKTGVIKDFGRDKRFVIVDLYNYGPHSFHSSDVSFNDYADSEEEDADWREREGIDGEFDEAVDPGISKDDETEFHQELDNLVHRTFGKRPEEKEVDEGAYGDDGWEPEWERNERPEPDEDWEYEKYRQDQIDNPRAPMPRYEPSEEELAADAEAKAERNAKLQGVMKWMFPTKESIQAEFDKFLAEGEEKRKTNATWAQITDYEKRAKATKDDIKKAHYEKMAKDLRAKLPTNEGIEDKLEAAREKAAAKGKIKDKEEDKNQSNVRKVAGKQYGGSKQKEEQVDEGYKVMPPINRERYTDLSHEGLEGPFMMQNGKVVYYDPREGKYYDRDTDMYLSHEEMDEINRYGLAEGDPDIPMDQHLAMKAKERQQFASNMSRRNAEENRKRANDAANRFASYGKVEEYGATSGNSAAATTSAPAAAPMGGDSNSTAQDDDGFIQQLSTLAGNQQVGAKLDQNKDAVQQVDQTIKNNPQVADQMKNLLQKLS